jgi:REP element-mobilizing transposase RayT
MLRSNHRKVVCDVIVRHCNIRQWRLLGLHVRTNHVHCVVQASDPIDQVMKEFKSWATRTLRPNGQMPPSVWTQGGSCKYIFTPSKLLEKLHYVIYEQGDMMEYYLDESIEF